MPSLNLDLDYFDHPKTRRLIGLLGRGAETLTLRLWAYCGKYHRKDGSLSAYSVEEIEAIADWRGSKGKAIEALVKVGFVDETSEGFVVHDWAEHAGHLEAFHLAAKAGAQARWGKKLASKGDKSGVSDAPGNADRNATRIAVGNAPAVHGSSLHGMAGHTREGTPALAPPPSALVEAWNANRGELAAVKLPLSSGREKHARARLAEEPDVKRWGEAVARLARSAFATGKVPGKNGANPWRADFDFLVRPDSLAKIEEGKYDDRTPTRPGVTTPEGRLSGSTAVAGSKYRSQTVEGGEL